MTIRYGLIGSGMMGQEHIRNLALLDGCQVTAVADPNEAMRNQAARLAGPEVRAFADYRQMLAADLCDALVVASPNDAHHPTLMALLDTPLPILCEKPLCTTTRDCRAVLAKAKGRKAPVWVAMEYRYMAPIQRLMEELSKDRAGSPRMMSIREHRFPFLHKVDAWNRFNARTGGTLVEKCCHFWDLMRLVLNSDPVRVYASAGLDVNHSDEDYDGRRPDILDNAYVVVDFANGARGMLDLCMFAEGSQWQEVVSVVGPRARIDAKVPGPARFTSDGKERPAELEISDRQSKVVLRETIEVDESILAAGDHFGSTYYQHQRFLALLQSGLGTPEVSLNDGLWSVMVGEAAEQSARSGQAVELKDL
jgi:predicted dehydrogenase